MNPIENLYAKIADPKAKRKDVAMAYRRALTAITPEICNWADVNAQIWARWSKSGLLWIKREAWKGMA